VIGTKGITLTKSPMYCINLECGAPLFLELMGAPNAELCFECDNWQFEPGAQHPRWRGYECPNCRCMLKVGEAIGRVAPLCKGCYLAGTSGADLY